MISFVCDSLEMTENIGEKLAVAVYSGTNILFVGDLGAGKTAFIKGFLLNKSINVNDIASPTYSIAHYYNLNSEKIVHYDLYRLNNVHDIGIDEDFWDDNTTVLVEWSERLFNKPLAYVLVEIKKNSESTRQININFVGFTLSLSKLADLISWYRIPSHVQSHIEAVTKVSMILVDYWLNQGEIIDKELVRQASLLHDLVRYVDFKGEFKQDNFKVDDDTWQFWQKLRQKYQGRHHAEVVNEILVAQGFPNIGKVILAHKSEQIFLGFNNLAEKILHYADKRCKHDKIVLLSDRIQDLQARYAFYHHNEQFWQDTMQKSLLLEQELHGTIVTNYY